MSGVNGGYSENEVARWLCGPWDQLKLGSRDVIDDLPRQLDPLECDAEWLDYLAGLCGFTGPYWDRDWPVGAKRKLLDQSFNLIWPYKGTSRVLSYVLIAFDIQHTIQEGSSFIIGVDEVGEELGLIAWDYTIVLPYSYYRTEKEALTRRLDRLYGPCWCTRRIVFETNFFETYEVLGYTEDSQIVLLSPEVGVALTPMDGDSVNAPVWILEYGRWNDEGIWQVDGAWRDSPFSRLIIATHTNESTVQIIEVVGDESTVTLTHPSQSAWSGPRVQVDSTYVANVSHAAPSTVEINSFIVDP